MFIKTENVTVQKVFIFLKALSKATGLKEVLFSTIFFCQTEEVQGDKQTELLFQVQV